MKDRSEIPPHHERTRLTRSYISLHLTYEFPFELLETEGSYIHTYVRTYIRTYIMDVSVSEWLAWLTSNCGRIGAIGSSPSNGLRPNIEVVIHQYIYTYIHIPARMHTFVNIHIYTHTYGEREREMFYLTTHSTHFIYAYMASDIW